MRAQLLHPELEIFLWLLQFAIPRFAHPEIIFIKERRQDAPLSQKSFSAVIFWDASRGLALEVIHPAFSDALENSTALLPYFHG